VQLLLVQPQLVSVLVQRQLVVVQLVLVLVQRQLVLVPQRLVLALLLELKSEQKLRQKLILMPKLIIIYSFTSPIYVKFHFMVKLNLQRTTYFN
jgi:hypothetical protein